jgi:hypothetical protein
MAKNLTFTLDGTDYAAAPIKIERKKLYGWSEVIALDGEGGECSLVGVDETGSFIIPKGGTGIGILTPDGRWVDRSSLKAVDGEGRDVPLIPSSFDAPIVLNRTASAETVLDYVVTTLYQLDGGSELAAAIKDAIYAFSYNPRTDYEGSDALLLAQEGEAFMLLGHDPGFAFIGLEQAETIDEGAEDEGEAEDADIDFSMF